MSGLDWKRNRASKGGKAADHTSPLRKVVRLDEQPIYGITNTDEVVAWRTVEVLECGHEQAIKQDMAGEYGAVRRRCKQCAKEAREDEDLEAQHSGLERLS